MAKSILIVMVLLCLFGMVPQAASSVGQAPPQAPAEDLYLVPNEQIAALPTGARIIHYYGESVLAYVPGNDKLALPVRTRITAVPRTDQLAYRSWSGNLADRAAAAVRPAGPGYYLLGLVGPTDQAWLEMLTSAGVQVLDSCSAPTVLVKADNAALLRSFELRTSEGFPIVRGVEPVPLHARIDPELLALARGEIGIRDLKGARIDELGRLVVRVDGFPDQAEKSLIEKVRAHAEHAAPEWAYSCPTAFFVNGPELLSILNDIREVAYISVVGERELHNNLAPKDYILNITPVWDLGYNGTGIIVGHNDGGVNLTHPDFPSGVIIATYGAMTNTDNEHGTHTAGSVLGRGLAASSPTNTSGCGDQTTPLSTVRGMAHGARLVTNNMFDSGYDDVTTMMRWSYTQGARLNTNSWGWTTDSSYNADSAAVDNLVRDASTSSGNQALAIIFSAGNSGPSAGTVRAPGNAKNALTVGATQNDRCGSYVPGQQTGPNINTVTTFSSRGPSQTYRIKPDVVAVGADVLSVDSLNCVGTTCESDGWDQSWTGTYYRLMPGTSMSCPITAGATTIFYEFYNDVYGALPSPALAKAAMINGAVDIRGVGFPDYNQGWGRINLQNSITGPTGGEIEFIDQDEVTPLVTGASWTHNFSVSSSSVRLKITLVWTDPASTDGDTSPWVNDLNLVVTAPDGTVYRGNRFTGAWSTANATGTDIYNNVENVFVQTPAIGNWSIQVTSAGTNQNPPNLTGQDFAIVYSGVFCSATPPTGVTAAGEGNNAIRVNWNTVSGATEYRVYRSTVSGSGYTLAGTVSSPTTSYLDSSVSGGITYYYVVRSYVGCESSASTEASAATAGVCNLPPVFAGLTSVTTPGDTGCTLDLAWSEATVPCGGTVTYSVFRATSTGFTPGLSNRIAAGITGTSYQDTDGLAPATTYYYIVRATDEGNGVTETNSAEQSGIPLGSLTDGTWSAGAESGDPAMYTNGSWSISSARKSTGNYSYYSGYSNNLCAFVRTPDLTLTPGQISSLTYKTAFSIEDTWDGGVVEISTDSGSTWTRPTLSPQYPGRFSQQSTDSCGYGNIRCYTGVNTTFTTYSVDLSGYDGQTIMVRWNFSTDQNTLDEGWYIDDIVITHVQIQGACSGTPADVLSLTATATSGKTKLEWVNPPSDYSSTIIRYSSTAYPTSPTDGNPVTTRTGVAGAYDSYEHTSGVSNGTTYYYAAFVYNGSAYSSGKTVAARPFDTSGAVKWAYSTGATALAPPGVNPGAIGAGGVYAVSNDRNLHATNPSAAGGDWPRAGGYTWEPMAMNGPAQDRPAVVPTELVSGAAEVAFVGSQDGYVYAADAETGAPLWTSASLGEVVQAAPSAMFTAYGGDYDLVFAATRNATSENKVYALNPATGATLFSFNNGGGTNAMGIISGGVLVDYDTNRVYFASRAKGGGSSHTVWCLSFNGSAFTKVWSQPLGDIDGVPVVWNGRVFVGTNAGVVYCLDAADGSTEWSYNTGTGTPVKAYLFPTYTATPHRLFFSTSNNVYCITDDGGADYTVRWTVTDIPSPSTPLFLFGTSYIYVGSSDGRLYQINTTTGAHTSVALTPGVTPAPVVGSPAYDYVNRMVYVGTDTGVMYAVSVPLP